MTDKTFAPSNTSFTNNNDNNMEDIIATTPQEIHSNSSQEAISHDTTINDQPTQTPINNQVVNSTFMDEDHPVSSLDKGKSTDTQTNKPDVLPNQINITVLKDLFEHSPQESNKAYKGFIPRDSFLPELTNNDIINTLKSAFINDNNAFKFEVNVLSTYRYFTILFRTRDSLNQYIEKSPTELKNIKIYELTNNAINTLIEQKFKNLDNAVIQIMDIPYNYDTKMLLKHLANKTKSTIIDYKEIKKPPKRLPGFNRQGRPTFVNPTYKQLIVRFQKQSAYDYFMQEEYWSLEIENFSVRILPGNKNNPIYSKRTSYYHKITGLPLNATNKDIEPIIKYLHGRTCTFTQTSKYSIMKNAYIYVDENNFPKEATGAINTSYNGSSIFIFPSTITTKTCNVCGSCNHTFNNCDDKNFILDKNNRKIFTKRLIKRNEEKITIDDKYKTTYNHVIALNANRSRLADTNTTPQNARFQQNRSQYRAPPLQGNFNRLQPHNSFAQNQNQNTPRTQNNPHQNYENLYEKIRQLENQVHTLNTRITQLENNPVQYEKKFSNIETQVTNITTNINTINAQQVKYDEILQKLTDNISKLSEAVYVRDKPAKTPKRIAPYDKTSYEQTKKKHFTRSSSKPSSSKNSADDSDNFPQTEDDAIMQQHLENFTDNAVDDGIIEPDSDYTQNENAPISSPYGYGIFNFASRK
ncbi:hypothetical protein RhiirA5_450587 [Rhizophagus irregularis]|uniref:Uncharacterized protein n=1 Tax=Rhizophagus irregularis TaxID=588596 RepID=A0A2I1F7V1_9GLOM|nr:hypothetical protein RhiirA5_433174 [Rhizophagus irregularis]PKB97455.1 hypothetical protein RhiirA5_433127 [Rhizophagus irregularis]PKC03750.1 hypothetical protein RhiirA5_450587 [Rhizophagus irregularis]PKC56528.1 hypothetical protein RhiirA1_473859 [Rhizophagus irregularis]PKC70578.1 hypothetical protein RhiirA1_454574 [Rhizophagus irregularis]